MPRVSPRMAALCQAARLELVRPRRQLPARDPRRPADRAVRQRAGQAQPRDGREPRHARGRARRSRPARSRERRSALDPAGDGRSLRGSRAGGSGAEPRPREQGRPAPARPGVPRAAARIGAFVFATIEGLLQAWRQAYRFDRHTRRSYFTLLQGRALQEKLRSLDPDGARVASRTRRSPRRDLQAPAVRQPRTWLYVDPDVRSGVRIDDRKPSRSIPARTSSYLIPDDAACSIACETGTQRSAVHERRADVRRPCARRRSWRGGRGRDPPATAQAGVVAAPPMSPEPRHEGDYTDRQVDAARRVLVDVGQVLASFGDAIVVVGGWVPDLLLPAATPASTSAASTSTSRSMRRSWGTGRYAELLKLLLDTGRYEKGDKDFQLVTTVDLGDDEVPVRVEVEFLAPADVRVEEEPPEARGGLSRAPVPGVRGRVRDTQRASSSRA